MLALAESEKDRDNYSLNRQSLTWRPHNQACVCILGRICRKASQKSRKMKNRAIKYARGGPARLILQPGSQAGCGSGHQRAVYQTVITSAAK